MIFITESNVISDRDVILTTYNEKINETEHLKHKVIDIEKYSSLKTLLNVTGWVLRCVNNFRSNASDRNFNKYLSNDERNLALLYWIRLNQNMLQNGDKYEEVKSSLNLVKDEKGIIRAYGRLRKAWIPEKCRNRLC